MKTGGVQNAAMDITQWVPTAAHASPIVPLAMEQLTARSATRDTRGKIASDNALTATRVSVIFVTAEWKRRRVPTILNALAGRDMKMAAATLIVGNAVISAMIMTTMSVQTLTIVHIATKWTIVWSVLTDTISRRIQTMRSRAKPFLTAGLARPLLLKMAFVIATVVV